MTYKFQIDEVIGEPGRLSLKVSTIVDAAPFPHWQVTDIIEGSYVMVINRLTSYYDDGRRLRTVNRAVRKIIDRPTT